MTMVAKASKTGVDVFSADSDEKLFDFDYMMFKIKTQATQNIKMYRTTVNEDVDRTETSITVLSTTGFPSSGFFWMYGYHEPIPGLKIYAWEAISYTGKTSTAFTGCTRGYKSTTTKQVDSGCEESKCGAIVNGQYEVSISHGMAYEPVHVVLRTDDVTFGEMIPNFFSDLGYDAVDAWVDTSNLYIRVFYDDLNVEDTFIPSAGSYNNYDFAYTIMWDAIKTPYY